MKFNYLFFVFCFILGYSFVLCQLSEGSECISEEGLKGKCVDIYKCMQVIKDLKEKNYPQICSYKGEVPVICCTDCELINDTRIVMIDRFGLHYFKTGRKAHDKCLKYLIEENYPCQLTGGYQRYFDDERLCYNYVLTSIYALSAGGEDAKRGQYPHMVRYHPASLRMPNECVQYFIEVNYPCQLKGGFQRFLDDTRECYDYRGTIVSGGIEKNKGRISHVALLGYGDTINTAEWLCGGSIISHRYILTAAHCLSSHAAGKVKFIALGILKRTDPAEMWNHYNVKRIVVHPEYKSPSKYHDIALLETDKWIKFTHLILPACLNTDTDGLEYVAAFATGWGAKGHRQALADNMQKVFLESYSQAECSAMYPEHRHLVNGYNHTTQMCYGDRDNINDTCEGDSGGPLQIHSDISSCAYKIIGVTSFGSPCGFVGGSGMYTRVSHYVPWIESIVWP